MIDLHCHFLPGVDDGPDTLQEALDLARAAVADGITHSVLTSHVNPDLYPNDQDSLKEAVAQFSVQLRQAGIALNVSLGAEARLCPELFDMLAQDRIPFLGTLAGFRILLLEFPHQTIPLGSGRFIGQLLKLKIRPLIAHPERNKAIMLDPDKVREFTQSGCWLQITAGSLVGRFGLPAQQTAFKLIDEGWSCVIGTDAHNMQNRPPLLSEGRNMLSQRYGEAAAHSMVIERPSRILGRATA